MNAQIEKILEVAKFAPSGDNAQPWRFQVKGETIEVYNDESVDNSLYNYNQIASYIAIGAVIENIMIVARSFGYAARSEFNTDSNSYLISRVYLSSIKPQEDELFSSILNRATNRKPYEKEYKLTNDQLRYLLDSSRDIGDGIIKIIVEKQKITELAKIASKNEMIVLENKRLHDYLFEHIRWSQEEAEKTGNGMHIDTFEFNPIQKNIFKLFKKWETLSFFNKLGVAKFIARESAAIYSLSSAIGVIVVHGNIRHDYFLGGRLMQRIWLKATKLGLNMQLLTGVTLLHQRLNIGEDSGFSSEHNEILKNEYKKVMKIFSLKNETIVMMFRIGRGNSATRKTTRLPLNSLLIKER